MRQLDDAIIACAVTGAIHVPTMSPHLPITPEEIAAEAIAAAEAGASIVHVHVRDPETGEPTSDLDLFRAVAERVHDACDVVVQPTTGGGPGMSVEELFGDDHSFSVIGAGRKEFPLGTQAVSTGGHARVGLEDNLYLRRGKLAESNAALVEKMVELTREVAGREPATPDRVREFLGLKGREEVAFA